MVRAPKGWGFELCPQVMGIAPGTSRGPAHRIASLLRPPPPLTDQDSSDFTGVQSAAVNVICELARRNPKNYLSLAPLFFKLMTSSTNNWVLIKIIKLASVLNLSSPFHVWKGHGVILGVLSAGRWSGLELVGMVVWNPRCAVLLLLSVTQARCSLVWCSDPLGAKVGQEAD